MGLMDYIKNKKEELREKRIKEAKIGTTKLALETQKIKEETAVLKEKQSYEQKFKEAKQEKRDLRMAKFNAIKDKFKNAKKTLEKEDKTTSMLGESKFSLGGQINKQNKGTFDIGTGGSLGLGAKSSAFELKGRKDNFSVGTGKDIFGNKKKKGFL